MQRVMVIGASGRIGSSLVARLRALDEVEVVAIDRATTAPEAGNLRTGSLDVRDSLATTRLIAEHHPDSVVLLAGISGAACDADPELAGKVNIEGATNITRAAVDAGVRRLVFPSTSAVYGDHYDSPAGESAATAPMGAYGATKFAAEQAIAAGAEGSDLSAAILRTFNVYGPLMHQSLVERLRRSGRDDPVPLLGWDSFARDYSHVADITEALVRSLAAELPEPATVINVGTGVATSNHALVELLGRHQQVWFERVSEVPSYSCANPERARDLLGFVPRSLAEVLFAAE